MVARTRSHEPSNSVRTMSPTCSRPTSLGGTAKRTQGLPVPRSRTTRDRERPPCPRGHSAPQRFRRCSGQDGFVPLSLPLARAARRPETSARASRSFALARHVRRRHPRARCWRCGRTSQRCATRGTRLAVFAATSACSSRTVRSEAAPKPLRALRARVSSRVAMRSPTSTLSPARRRPYEACQRCSARYDGLPHVHDRDVSARCRSRWRSPWRDPGSSIHLFCSLDLEQWYRVDASVCTKSQSAAQQQSSYPVTHGASHPPPRLGRACLRDHRA